MVPDTAVGEVHGGAGVVVVIVGAGLVDELVPVAGELVSVFGSLESLGDGGVSVFG
jgi:hypothetical protein